MTTANHTMKADPDITDQLALADTRERNSSGMTASERMAELLVGTGMLAATAALWLIAPPERFAVEPALLAMITMAIAIRVRFHTPYGFTVATQLAFVPLVFVLPPSLVPVAVVLTLACSRLPDVLTGAERPKALLATPSNAWFSVGPALVLGLAHTMAASAGPVLLLAAFAAQLAGDFTASCAYHALARRATVADQLRDSWWVYPIDAGLTGVGLVVADEAQRAPVAVLALIPLLVMLAALAGERNKRLAGLIELNATYGGTARLLGQVIAHDDGYTGEHSEGVVGLALAIGERLGLTADRRRNLEFGALLHDVGKITIPKEIINKPGKLEHGEMEIVRTHPAAGQEMLDIVGGFMRDVGWIVRAHHERFDGGGYPDGLIGDEIPLEARIIACADTWSAMRSDRPYRKALPLGQAVAEMRANAGSQFDPQIVDALLAILDGPVSTAALSPEADQFSHMAQLPVALLGAASASG